MIPKSLRRPLVALAGLGLVTLLQASALAQNTPARPRPYAVRNVRLSPSDDAPKKTILLRDGRIESIQDASLTIPADVWEIDGEGLVAVPAFVDAFTTAARLNPDSPITQIELGDTRNRMGDLDGAIEAYTRATELDATRGRAHARLAVLHYYAGNDAAAWASLRRADKLGAVVPSQFRVLLAQRTPEG